VPVDTAPAAEVAVDDEITGADVDAACCPDPKL
jgi:hypothetical protein